MSHTVVSIIVPCYNQAQYLPEALQSVLEQTYSNWECIIVNDGSPDHTEKVAQEWLQRDSRFKYIYKENGGLSSARNTGIEIAGGKYILPLDADDKIGKDYLKLAIEEFAKDSQIKLVYCKAEKFGVEVGEWHLSTFHLNKLFLVNMIFCSALFKKADWEIVGGYDTNLILGLEDWEFWIALLKDGGNVYKLEETHFYYRIKAESMIKSISENEKLKIKEYILQKHAAFYIKSLLILKAENTALKQKIRSEKFLINRLSKKIFGLKLFKNVE